MKKYLPFLAVAGLTLSFSSFAASPECCLDLSSGLCAPKLPGGFYIGVTGLYIQPSETGLGQATDSWGFNDTLESTLSEFHSEDRSAVPDLEWEWAVTVGYDIPCTAYFLEASYFHLNNDTHAVNTSSDKDPISFSSYLFPNAFFPIGAPTGTTPTILSLISDAHLKYDLDQADLKLGRQFYNVCGGRFKVAAAVGARYARLEHDLTFASPASLAIPVGDVVLTTDNIFRGQAKSEFEGIGPMLSLDLRYGLGMGIGVVGHFNGALIAGHVDSSSFITVESTVVDPFVGSTTVTTNRFQRPTIHNVVPNSDAKLGLDYTYCFCNRSSLTLEVGYQASKYWDSFNIIRGDTTTSASAPAQRFTGIETNSFSFQGPYASLMLHL